LAVFFAAALLVAWSGAGSQPAAASQAALTGTLLGIAVLAKALVPIALSMPLIWWWRKRPRDLFITFVAMLAVAGPWYWFCYARNGREFIDVLIVQHHFARFFKAEAEVLHPGPWWYYIPVLLAGLLPGTPFLTSLTKKAIWKDPLVCYLASIFGFGFLFLSASEGKLPGYLLPLLPFLTGVMGIAAARMEVPRWATATAIGVAVLLTIVLPALIPRALEYGIGQAEIHLAGSALAASAAVALAMRWIAGRVRPLATALLVLATTATLLIVLKLQLAKVLEEQISARREWRRIEQEIEGRDFCQTWLRRTWLYGFNYYRGREIPACADPPEPGVVRLESDESTGRAVVRE
jgi:4-amino-4-deoxy-L-arabinose transferase-like glycosyltransferase